VKKRLISPVSPGIILDFNKQDEVVGIEVLRVKNRIPLASLKLRLGLAAWACRWQLICFAL
jgi:hypothetical protein